MFNNQTKQWTWLYSTDSNNEDTYEMPYTTGQDIKFKVTKTNICKDPDVNGNVGHFVYGSCAEKGLGMVDWWRSQYAE